MNASLSKVIRRTHMYLALFLVPWVLMYAVSTLAMNHRDHLETFYETPRSAWMKERQPEFKLEFPSDADPSLVATTILAEVELDGRHSVRGKLENGELTIIRHETFAPRRIKYKVGSGTLSVERKESRLHEWLNALHSRRNYDQGYAVEFAWALSVDLVIGSLLFWRLSGLWLWWGIPKARWLGGLCLLAGATLFCAFLMKT